ncbi:ATP-binding protein, partial [Pseudomonas aeruginosa]|nr:ATP-binding protein [Pseudomonas aeruginosa]
MSLNKIGQVISCSPSSISIAIDGLEKFEENKKDLQIGRLLKISQGNSDFTIATIRNIKGIDAYQNDGTLIWQFQVECQAIGTMSSEGKFDRGSLLLPVPTEPAYIADHDTIEKLFAEDNEHDFPLGKLSLNKDISLKINGNRFFGKHIAIVGSTGSGKSCTVAKILQDAVGISESQNKSIAAQNNSHIVIFDIHDEYTAAFNLHEDEKFSLNRLDIDSLQLPYWLMNSEELESMFIESNESNSHNQVSQFKNAVTLNKEKHNPSLLGITYDTPVYFSIKEVYQYIENLNREIIGRLDGE